MPRPVEPGASPGGDNSLRCKVRMSAFGRTAACRPPTKSFLATLGRRAALRLAAAKTVPPYRLRTSNANCASGAALDGLVDAGVVRHRSTAERLTENISSLEALTQALAVDALMG